MSDSGASVQAGASSSEQGPDLLPIGPPPASSHVSEAELAGVVAEASAVAGAALVSKEGAPQGDARSFRMRRLIAFADISALCIAWVLTGVLLDSLGRVHSSADEFLLFLAFLPVWVLFGSLSGLYHGADRRVDPSVADEIGKLLTVVTAWTWGYLLVRGAVTSGPNQLLPAVTLWVLLFLGLVLLRPVARHHAHTRPWFTQNVLVLGHRGDVDRVWRRLTRHPEYGLDPILEPEVWTELCAGAGEDRLLQVVREGRIARVMLATPIDSIEMRGRVVRRLREAGVQVDLATGSADAYAPSVMLNYLEGIPVLSVPVVQRNKAMRVMKRLFDLVAASLAVLVLSPLLLFCALRIKLDSRGPVFFRQMRFGRDEVPFKVFKFRSMVDGADAKKHEIDAMNMHGAENGAGRMFKIPEDPRITKSGAWLRRWSLDELPQLFNVIRGEMSLVGPRPLIPEEATLIDEHYKARFQVLPGVTGAWQAHGRSDIGFEDMVQLDYMYVSNWSFSEDLKLILRTVEVILHGRGAY